MASILSNLEYIQFIEPHLSFQIHEFLLKNNPSNATVKSQYLNLLANSHNYQKQKEHGIKTDAEITQSKAEITARLEEMESNLIGFLNLVDNCKKINNYDLNNYSLAKKIIDETSPLKVLEYCKCLCDNGQHEKAKSILYGLAKLNETIKKNQSKCIVALYLIYSINILIDSPSEEIEESFIDILKGIDKLKDYLDEEFKKINFDAADKITVDFKQILLYRGYIIHWALFLLKNNIDLFLEVLFEEKYFTLIQSTFPYLIKYQIIFTLLSKSRKHINQLKESFISHDELKGEIFADMFHAVYVSYDYDLAMKKMRECTEVMKGDYFLAEHIQIFEAKCKEIIVENYIMTNEYIELKELSQLFGGDKNKTKEMITNSIRANYPLAEIISNEDSVQYAYSDKTIQEYYEMKSNELFSITKNMISYMKEEKVTEDDEDDDE